MAYAGFTPQNIGNKISASPGYIASQGLQRRSGAVASRGVAGNDPFLQRQAAIDTNRQASGQSADFLNNADLQIQQGNQDFFRSMLGGAADREFQTQQAKLARDAASSAAWKQLLGQGIGAGASALAGGAGGGHP